MARVARRLIIDLTRDGLPGKEGAFGIASFWVVEYLTLAGRLAEANERFERLLKRSNDVGLYAEEIDPETGAALGNFPQAFTHVGLITAAMAPRRSRDAISGVTVMLQSLLEMPDSCSSGDLPPPRLSCRRLLADPQCEDDADVGRRGAAPPRPAVRAGVALFPLSRPRPKKVANEAFEKYWPNYAQYGGATAFVHQINALRTADTLAVAGRLPKLNVPARVVWGAADGFQKIEYAERFSRDLRAPLRRIEQGKHLHAGRPSRRDRRRNLADVDHSVSLEQPAR